mgnify:CR=1 FL=1
MFKIVTSISCLNQDPSHSNFLDLAPLARKMAITAKIFSVAVGVKEVLFTMMGFELEEQRCSWWDHNPSVYVHWSPNCTFQKNQKVIFLKTFWAFFKGFPNELYVNHQICSAVFDWWIWVDDKLAWILFISVCLMVLFKYTAIRFDDLFSASYRASSS